MARYRHTWPTDYGWNLRLDIIPYDGTLDDSPTALDAGTVLSIGPLEQSFDELPVGLMNAPTMSVTLNWTRLPSALQTRLANMTSGNDRFCFLFFTDRGTSGVTYTLEFCGTLANEETADFDPVINDEGILTDDYQITLDLVDCLHHVMSSTNGSIFDGSLYAASNTVNRRLVYDYRVSSQTAHFDAVQAKLATHYHVSSWAHCMDRMRTSLSAILDGQYLHTTNASQLADDDSADVTFEWDTFINTGAIFKQRVISSTAGTALDEDTAYLITHVYSSDGTVVGGLWDNSDEYGWYSVTAIIDLVKDFCETFCVKASYYPTYVTDAGGDYIFYTWNIAPVGDSTDSFTSALSTDLTKALSIGTTSQGSTTIQKAETRFDLNSAKYNYDVTEYVSINSRSRSTRSFNFEPILHNTPGYKPKVFGSNGVREIGLYQTNRILGTLADDYAVTAHQETTVTLSDLSGITSVIAFSEARPPFNESSSGDTLADNERDHGVFTAWLNTAQQASSPCSVAKAYRTAFSSGFQCSLEVDFPITYSNNVRPHRFAWVHNLSGGPASVFTHLPWGRACITGMSCDYTTGTNTITYVLLKLS